MFCEASKCILYFGIISVKAVEIKHLSDRLLSRKFIWVNLLTDPRRILNYCANFPAVLSMAIYERKKKGLKKTRAVLK